MNPVLSDEAVEPAEAAGKAFAALGGVGLARRARAGPPGRARAAGPPPRSAGGLA